MRSIALFIALLFMEGTAFASASMGLTSVSDISVGSWGLGDPAISTNMDMCVYAGGNSPAGGYSITVTGNNNAYILSNGTQQIPYTLYWDDSGAGSLGSTSAQLTSGVPLTQQLHANTNTLNPYCIATGPTARLTLKITQAAMTSALAGTYTGTITLLLSPN